MGQRLVLTITRKGTNLANAYYHWSGYTGSSMDILETVYSHLSDYHDEDDKTLLAIEALEATGAGLADQDRALMQLNPAYEEEEFQEFYDRNKGILCCFDDTMQGSIDCDGVFVYIDIDTLIIDFGVACYYSDLDEVKEYIELDDDDDIPEFDASLSCCDIGTCRDIVNAILDNKVVKCDDGYYSKIG